MILISVEKILSYTKKKKLLTLNIEFKLVAEQENKFPHNVSYIQKSNLKNKKSWTEVNRQQTILISLYFKLGN